MPVILGSNSDQKSETYYWFKEKREQHSTYNKIRYAKEAPREGVPIVAQWKQI